MSAARRMQELRYFRDGATVVISLDGLNWLSKRTCSDKGIQKRDAELQVLMSSGRMIQADEELQPIACFCVLDQRGSAARQLWRNSDCRSSLVTRSPLLSTPPPHGGRPKKAPWTRLTLNMQDILSWIKRDLNIGTQEDAVTMDPHNRFIIFCDEDIPLQRFGDICHTEGRRTFVEDTGWHSSGDNMLSHLSSSVCRPHGPNGNNSNEVHRDLVITDDFNTCNPKGLLKPSQICDAPGVFSGREENVKKRKSVSFDDDVLVYLFDQESPTVELHSGPCTSLPSSYSCNQPDVSLEDIGLEWEDDFSALEKNCHFQCVPAFQCDSVSRRYTLSSPTQGCAALSRPERLFLPQTCLFLTHVTESDLEP